MLKKDENWERNSPESENQNTNWTKLKSGKRNSFKKPDDFLLNLCFFFSLLIQNFYLKQKRSNPDRNVEVTTLKKQIDVVIWAFFAFFLADGIFWKSFKNSVEFHMVNCSRFIGQFPLQHGFPNFSWTNNNKLKTWMNNMGEHAWINRYRNSENKRLCSTCSS